MSEPSESANVFAWVSIVQGIVHLGSAVSYALNAPFKLYMLGDYVSVLLLLLAAFGLLRWDWGPGLLCAGWAFELSIYLRAVLSRLDTLLVNGSQSDEQLLLQLYVMAPWLLLVAVAFVYSARLCLRDS